MKNDLVLVELRRIADEHAGKLLPRDIVEAARPEGAPLHSQFEWDDTEAAERWRIHQARMLLNVVVEYIDTGDGAYSVQAFVSLRPDRITDSGYTRTVGVLSNVRQRQQLLEDALEELAAFREKYRALRELASIFEAMKKVRKKIA
jgi:hypothetical protein